MAPAHGCPCCGYLTLRERGTFETCPVCFWEDDGQDDVDAHIARGGPNHGTLWQARANFLKVGACEDIARQHVRALTPGEPRLREWSLFDGVALESIAASNLDPWNCLHDGLVTAIERQDGGVTFSIEISYLRSRFDVPGGLFRVEILDCSHVEYRPYEGTREWTGPGTTLTSLDEIAHALPNIVEATHDGEDVVIWGSTGELHLRYRALALRFDDGSPLALTALLACSQAYWDDWDRDARQGRLAPNKA